jgi:hypothetical protein
MSNVDLDTTYSCKCHLQQTSNEASITDIMASHHFARCKQTSYGDKKLWLEYLYRKDGSYLLYLFMVYLIMLSADKFTQHE